jgi:hypothetical protein
MQDFSTAEEEEEEEGAEKNGMWFFLKCPSSNS